MTIFYGIFHSCQLEKHVKRSFDVSKNILSNMFHIVHYGLHPLLALVVCATMLFFLTTILITFGCTHSNKNPMCLLNFYYFQNTSKTNLVQPSKLSNVIMEVNTITNNLLTILLLTTFNSNSHAPHTSQQNGKSKQMLRTITYSVYSLIFQAHKPPTY